MDLLPSTNQERIRFRTGEAPGTKGKSVPFWIRRRPEEDCPRTVPRGVGRTEPRTDGLFSEK